MIGIEKRLVSVRIAGGVTLVYGLIAKITVAEGKRGEMIDILKASAAALPGCHSYVIAKDAADANVVWVTEVWDSETSHDASVSLPTVKAAIPRAKPIITEFERVAITEPVWDAASDAAPRG